MTKILGIDLGTNSIGWAITTQYEDKNNYQLLEKGVSIFQEGVAREKNNEVPMVKERTNARSLRRQYFRRRLRKIEILKVLIKFDLCPVLTTDMLNNWRYKKQYPLDEKFLQWLRTDDNCDKNPYHDRYIALTRVLDLDKQDERFLLGRALYHIAQRRGFLSNRKDSSNDNESGKVKSAIKGLDEAMANADCEYLGEFYYKLYQDKHNKNIRNRDMGNGFGYADRNRHYLKEFEAICKKQNLPADLQDALARAIFFQRPLKSQKGIVGTCTFEKNKARCPISHPRFEEFRMLQVLNNIKIKGPYDEEMRPLTDREREEAISVFMRKSKPHFDFEDIAKKLSGGRKATYSYYKEGKESDYLFNYKMTTSMSGCPTIAELKNLFGNEWLDTICSIYIKGCSKSKEQILNDIWHALFSFDNDDKLREWARTNLQLSNEDAEKITNIHIAQGYASLSLNAINKMLPYLRAGYRYDEAVFLGNLRKAIGENRWNNETTRKDIIDKICTEIDNYSITKRKESKKEYIAKILSDEYGIDFEYSDNLYHPSQVEGYKDAEENENGILQLGSPRTSAIRNPMAMRALFRLRALVNTLLREKKIDKDTRVNIEMARELNDANKRAAIKQYQEEQEKKHKEYADEIKKLYRDETGIEIEPTQEDILKYQLWEEQKHLCLYTQKTIGITEFIGGNSAYDIEHTVPRSRGGDNSQANKTLCDSRFNREIKQTKLPSELSCNYKTLAVIEELGWREEIESLEKKIATQTRNSKSATTKESKDKAIQQRHYLKMHLDYWRDKVNRFTMTEITDGFTKRQGVDIGIIGRYARMYLQTAFNNVHTVKGSTTADFRKMWGLQEEYSKKERVNHIHHCIDAITIACIGHGAYTNWKQYNEDTEKYHFGQKGRPTIEKPWPTFTEDVKAIANEVLISHNTPDSMPKTNRKKLRIRGKVQYNDAGEVKYAAGDGARRSLHMQTYYGAIMRDDEIKYVVRKPISKLESSDIEKIVDDAVKECVKEAYKREGKAALQKPICFNAEKGVFIKKVRIYAPTVKQPIHLKKHQHKSKQLYKQDYHVANDSNYCMAIYEGEDEKGRTKRGFEIVNNLDASKFFNGKEKQHYIVPQSDANDYPLKYIIKCGTMVLFYEKTPDELYHCDKCELAKRLYKVGGFSTLKLQNKYFYGTITLKHHQEARPAGELKAKNGEWKINEDYRAIITIYHTQFNALVEGYDFELTVTGEIKFK
ncbi:MAG: type II CRISPR RNA-guided endonuclease Cas9 [Bacteroidaceae bacterium]|nr:type II CRISPR RNA-guided endonuclease Cas9 [Bacteroidaceae bacterium]